MYKVVVKRGETISPEQDAELDRVLNEGPHRVRETLGAWSPEAISAALAWWAAQYCGRPDIRFSWNPDIGPSEMLLEAQANREKRESGTEKSYDLGGGIHASGQFMDSLINRISPEDAAKIMKFMREAFDNK